MEKLRPFTKIKWDEVAQAFNEQATEHSGMFTRDSDALKRRFMVLAYGKKSSDSWQDSVLRAMQLHHSILAENGELDQPPRLSIGGPGGMVTSGDPSDHILLLQDDESLPGYDDDGSRLPPRMTPLPVRTGKRGRPLGSTTGAAAKRMQKQAEQVAYLLNAVTQLQEQMREVREALATVVDTQSNQSAIISALQHRLDIRGVSGAGMINNNGLCVNLGEGKSEQEELSKQLREAAKVALNYQVGGLTHCGTVHDDEDDGEELDDEDVDDDEVDENDGEEDGSGGDSYNASSEVNFNDASLSEMLAN